MRRALEQLAITLAPGKGFHVSKRLKWPYDKKDVQELLSIIERQKIAFVLALQKDHVALAATIRDDVTRIGDAVNELQHAYSDDERDSIN